MTFPKNIWVFVNDEGAFEVGRTDTEDDLEAEYALSVFWGLEEVAHGRDALVPIQ